MTTNKESVALPAPYAVYLVGRELSSLSERISKIETGVVELCETSEQSVVHQAARSLQELDFALQYANALSTYTLALSQSLSEEVKIDLGNAISEIPLRDLALKLSGQPLDDETGIHSSEPDLF